MTVTHVCLCVCVCVSTQRAGGLVTPTACSHVLMCVCMRALLQGCWGQLQEARTDPGDQGAAGLALRPPRKHSHPPPTSTPALFIAGLRGGERIGLDT